MIKGLRNPKPTALAEAYEAAKDAAQRHNRHFDISFEEFVPIWTKLDESWRRKKNIKLSGVIDD